MRIRLRSLRRARCRKREPGSAIYHDSGRPLRLGRRSLAVIRQGWRRWVGNNNLTVTDVTTGVSLTCGNFTNCGNNNGGWLVGFGAEYAFAPNWTVKFEYDYLGLGNRTFTIPVTSPFILAGDTFTSNNRNVQMFKVGVNYLFNWGAPGYGRY